LVQLSIFSRKSTARRRLTADQSANAEANGNIKALPENAPRFPHPHTPDDDYGQLSIIEDWRQEYNESRPHRSLGERTPSEFASQIAASRDLTELKPAGD
jgi:transposase InsO family protein